MPLVYFHELLPGTYLASWRVFIRGDNPGRLQFWVSVDEKLVSAEQGAEDTETVISRRYVSSLSGSVFTNRRFG